MNTSNSSISSASSDSEFDPGVDLASQLTETFWERFLAGLQDDSSVNVSGKISSNDDDDDDDANDLDFDPNTQISDQFEQSVWSGFVGNIRSQDQQQNVAKYQEDISTLALKPTVVLKERNSAALKSPEPDKPMIKAAPDKFVLSYAFTQQIQSASQLILQSIMLCYLSPLYEKRIDYLASLVIQLTERATALKVPINFNLKQVRDFIAHFPNRLQESICKNINESLLKWDLPTEVYSIMNDNHLLFAERQIIPKCRFQPMHFCGHAEFSIHEDKLLLIANQRFKHFAVMSDRVYMIHRYMMNARQGSDISKRLKRLLSSSSSKSENKKRDASKPQKSMSASKQHITLTSRRKPNKK